jgi:acetyltransferase-like isoleucine patch superfamily enzyme
MSDPTAVLNSTLCVAPDVVLGQNIHLTKFINLYGCTIGDNTKIGPFVEVQRNATIGKNCKISSHSFICEGVHIGDGCFIGHGVMFVNDNHPRAVTPTGNLEADADWMGRMVETCIGNRVSIGTNATILGGVTIGEGAIVGAGSVVTRNIPAGEVWAGNPAKPLQKSSTKEACDDR